MSYRFGTLRERSEVVYIHGKLPAFRRFRQRLQINRDATLFCSFHKSHPIFRWNVSTALPLLNLSVRRSGIRSYRRAAGPLGKNIPEGHHGTLVHRVPYRVKWLLLEIGRLCTIFDGTICPMIETQRDRFRECLSELSGIDDPNNALGCARFLHERTGLGSDLLRKVHAGSRAISGDAAVRLADVFRVRPAWLLWGELPKHPLSPARARLIEKISRLTPQAQAALEAGVDAASREDTPDKIYCEHHLRVGSDGDGIKFPVSQNDEAKVVFPPKINHRSKTP